MRKKLLRISMVIIMVLLFSTAALYCYYKLCMDPYRGTIRETTHSLNLDDVLSKETALKDLAYLMECLRERHPAWLDSSGRDVPAEQQYEKELATMGDSVSVLKLRQTASRITSALHDGHTFIYWCGREYRYIDDFAAVRTCGKPLTINGIPFENMLAAYKQVYSYVSWIIMPKLRSGKM